MTGLPLDTCMPEVEDRPRGGELHAAIAKGGGQGHVTVTGRGPSRARASCHGNAVVVVLDSGLTRGERSLVEAGMTDAVLDTRDKLQDTMRGSLVELIEELTACEVRAFM